MDIVYMLITQILVLNILCKESEDLDHKDYIVGKLSRKLAENDKRGKNYNISLKKQKD